MFSKRRCEIHSTEAGAHIGRMQKFACITGLLRTLGGHIHINPTCHASFAHRPSHPTRTNLSRVRHNHLTHLTVKLQQCLEQSKAALACEAVLQVPFRPRYGTHKEHALECQRTRCQLAVPQQHQGVLPVRLNKRCAILTFVRTCTLQELASSSEMSTSVREEPGS